MSMGDSPGESKLVYGEDMKETGSTEYKLYIRSITGPTSSKASLIEALGLEKKTGE